MKTAEQIKNHIDNILEAARKIKDIKTVKKMLREVVFLRKCLPIAEEYSEAQLKKQLLILKVTEQKLDRQVEELRKTEPMTREQVTKFKKELLPNGFTQRKIITFILKPYDNESKTME
jgi:hypothetical protein